jgi:hypothetical protein
MENFPVLSNNAGYMSKILGGNSARHIPSMWVLV